MTDAAHLESVILHFEWAWQSGSPPEIADFLLRSANREERLRHLIELVCIDLEYRWRNSTTSQEFARWTLTDYIGKFEDLSALNELPLELIEEEYRVRRRWGDRPSQDAFVNRFKDQRAEIRQRLEQIDRELLDEADVPRPPPSRIAVSVPTAKPQFAATDPRVPLKFSDYLLQELIGAGRMGKVYRAWQRSIGRAVAVKYLRKSFHRDPDAVERFFQEARTVAQFQHPGIVRIHGLGATPGAGYFMAMQLIDGFDLSRRLTLGPVSVVDAVRWIIQACAAIEHAHERGVVHCDLKPANLLLDAFGSVRVTDFGLARSVYGEPGGVERIEGTAAFMAPEQISGWWGPISPRTDVYGIGAVLFTLLTGEPPYRGATIADVLAQVVSGTAVRPSFELRTDVPTAVKDLCLRCLAKSPRERYENMADLLAALHVAISDAEAI